MPNKMAWRVKRFPILLEALRGDHLLYTEWEELFYKKKHCDVVENCEVIPK